jgi:uncharacterized protein involved in cysteine biosynthesis
MKKYRAKFVGVLHHSISPLQAIICLCQGLQSFFHGNGDKAINLLITDTIAWLSVYSSYLPMPLKVIWIMFSSYYRPFNDASRKEKAAFL